MAKNSLKILFAFCLLLSVVSFSFGCSHNYNHESDESSSQTAESGESHFSQQTFVTNLPTDALPDKSTDTPTETTKRASPSVPNASNNLGPTSDEVDLKFFFYDRNGIPVQNLNVKISPIDDIVTDYTPCFTMSNLSGCSTGKAVAGNYRVIVQDRDETTVYSEMAFDLIVSADETNHQFVWENITPHERMNSSEDSIRFVITAGGVPLTNTSVVLYVGHHEVYDFWTTNPPETIELGTTDADGIVIWTAPTSGKYTLYTYIMRDGRKTKVAKQFVIDDMTNEFKVDF